MSFPFSIPLSESQMRTESATQLMPLGTRGYTRDGRIYRYAQAGATALTKGTLCEAAAGAAINTSTDTRLNRVCTTTHTEAHISTTMVASGTVSADDFKDGYLFCTDTTGTGGQYVHIKKSTASSSNTCSGTTGCILTFYPDSHVEESLTTASTVAPVKNMYKGIIVATAGGNVNALVGVPNQDVTEAYYFWLQTWGPCAVRQETTVIPLGSAVVSSTGTTGGAVECSSCTTSQLAGYRVTIGQLIGSPQATLEFVFIELRCSP